MPPLKHHPGGKKPSASPDVPVPITWADGVLAWQTARRHKRCGQDQLRFEACWLDALHTLVARLRAGQWWPSPAVCFAVRRLTGFMQARQQAAGPHASAGWYLKLDVQNYFNSIHRPTLYALLKRRIAQAQARRQLSWGMARALRSLCHRLLLAPQHQGIDFLGYRVFARHRGVRPRVLGHLREHLHAFAARHVNWAEGGMTPLRVQADVAALEQLRARLGSYWGHLAHANSARLRAALFMQFPWLGWLFGPQPGHPTALQPLWLPADAWHLQAHADWCAHHWPQARCCMQQGWGWRVWPAAQPQADLPIGPRWLMGVPALHRWTAEQRAQGRPYVRLDQTGYLRHGARLRTVCDWFGLPLPAVSPVWGGAHAPAPLCSPALDLNFNTFSQELCDEDF